MGKALNGDGFDFLKFVLITGCGAWLLQKRDGLTFSLKHRALNCFPTRTVATLHPHQAADRNVSELFGQTITARKTIDAVDPKIKKSCGLLVFAEPN